MVSLAHGKRALCSYYNFSAIRSFAERARLFCSNSDSDGRIGLREISFKIGLYSSGIMGKPCGNGGASLAFLRVALQIRSSREWKVITLILPSGFNKSMA